MDAPHSPHAPTDAPPAASSPASTSPTSTSPAPPSAPSPLLEVVDLCKFFSSRPTFLDRIQRRPARIVRAVDHVFLKVYPGEVVGLMGESGCGKTTLGKAICRLHPVTSGSVRLFGKDLLALPPDELRALRPRFQMLFQNPYSTLNPKMSVEAILRETLDVNFSLGKDAQDQTIQDALAKVRLTSKIRSYPPELSGGERRRVGLARLLLLDPSLIVADEPVAGLDASIKARIIDLMMETRSKETAYIFISHDLHVVRYVSTRVVVMYLGKIVEEVPIAAFDEDLHHPYTQTLLSASHHVRLHHGSGSPIDFSDLPSHTEVVGQGCPYVSRCPWAGNDVPRERCLQESPPLHLVGSDHQIACHRFQPKSDP